MGTIALLRRTLALTLDFTGRSARREFIAYVVLSQAPIALVRWVGGILVPEPGFGWLIFAVRVVVLAPAIALAARRLHDIGLSSRWGLILLALVAISLGLDLIDLAAGWDARRMVESLLSHGDWLLTVPAFVLYLGLLAVPARRSAARFGADPRLADAPGIIPAETEGMPG